MIAAKDVLASGLGDAAGGSRELLTACIDYLEFVIGRFVKQGMANTERLRAAVPGEDQENWRILEDIAATLAATRDELDRLLAARDADDPTLLAAGRRFIEFYNGTLARRKDPAQQIIQQYFDPETYWRETDDVTPESIDTEAQLFGRIAALAPEAVPAD